MLDIGEREREREREREYPSNLKEEEEICLCAAAPPEEAEPPAVVLRVAAGTFCPLAYKPPPLDRGRFFVGLYHLPVAAGTFLFANPSSWPQALLRSLKTPPRGRRYLFVNLNPHPSAQALVCSLKTPWPQALFWHFFVRLKLPLVAAGPCLALFCSLKHFPSWPQALFCMLETPARGRRHFSVRLKPLPAAAGTFVYRG